MKVLTIGQSPYLLTKLGRMHADVVKTLSKAHKVSAAAWEHDTSYFMSEEDGAYRYEGTRIHPFDKDNPKRFLEILKKVEPDVVVTIGDYYETSFVAEVKNFYWVAVLAIEALPIQEKYISDLTLIDHAVFTHNGAWLSAEFDDSLKNIPNSVVPYGFDQNIFHPDEGGLGNVFWTICCAKNKREDNPVAYLDGAGLVEQVSDMVKMRHYLHTNIHDKGTYDLESLVEDVNNDGIWLDISLPYRYSSVKEGIPDSEMRELFARSAVVVDTSSRSSTGLSVMQGMACGCVPLVTPACGSYEAIRGLDDLEMFLIESNPYLNERHEVEYIASPISLAVKLTELYRLWRDKREEYEELRGNCVKVVRRYSKISFEREIEKVVAKAKDKKKPTLPVDVF